MKQSAILTSVIFSICFARSMQTLTPLQKGILGIFDTLNHIGQTGLHAIRTPVIGLSDASKLAIKTIQNTKSQLLHGTAEALKSGTGATADLVSIIPGMSYIANPTRDLINGAVDFTNAAGQTLFHAENGLVNYTVDAIRNLVDKGGLLTSGAMHHTNDLAKLYVQMLNGKPPHRPNGKPPQRPNEDPAWAKFVEEMAEYHNGK